MCSFCQLDKVGMGRPKINVLSMNNLHILERVDLSFNNFYASTGSEKYPFIIERSINWAYLGPNIRISNPHLNEFSILEEMLIALKKLPYSHVEFMRKLILEGMHFSLPAQGFANVNPRPWQRSNIRRHFLDNNTQGLRQ
jgi:hypothetical protein